MKKYIILFVALLFLFLQGCELKIPSEKDEAQEKLLASMEFSLHETLKESIEQGVDLNHFSKEYRRRTNNGKSESNPLRIGLYNMVDRYTVKKMLEAGADANAYDCEGYPLVFYSAWNEDEALCRLFLSYGADVSLKNKQGDSILDYYLETNETGIYLSRKNLVKLYLDESAKVSRQTLKIAESCQYGA
ncbi:Ankyrin repeats (3 copies) [uncultured Roseburia sp.]|uniref:Ankyrin repeat domain-containing protein n=1 Tax=Brotonthovivens ammoniilytica TaxID=2981725 RepID=A0ABT2TK04_9FIRM|nr:hypothetical protein [Brotonthovivens ammoniilytica]MCU6762538.1 hypothetical protein [Brotonthovivens ammoniilytica]SCI75091.1 Ankyrin repeats (3 copies) [uncultured Roseburia sp.]